MKKLLTLAMLLLCSSMYSQCNVEYRFRKPTLSSGVYKFSNVLGSTDAYISQVGSNNASINAIDDSTVYPYAWQPFIRFTNSTSSASDSSYVEFLVQFKQGSTLDTQSCVEVTIIDCDGTSNYREIIKSSLPVFGRATLTSSVTYSKDSNWFAVYSPNFTYSAIDTTNQDVMAELKYSNIVSFKLRVGVVGIVSANQVRQYSFYFKHFDSILISLPLKPIKKRDYVKEEERVTSIYSNQYGITFEGTMEEFVKWAVAGELYYDTRGKKFIIIK
jgi:hypothetical protein